CARWQSVFDNW
nr:immunoglobulin heavy chain junction region [Macaca mulatta]